MDTITTFFDNFSHSPEGIAVGKLLLSSFLGALVGIERDIHGRTAGLRTHLLVALGSTLFMLISLEVSGADPSRIAAQIVSGIGFLGAGAIMKEGINVRGLTTASCLWIVAAVGMAVAEGNYFLAIVTTIISLFAVALLNNFDRFFMRESYRVIYITLAYEDDYESLITSLVDKNIAIKFVDYEHDLESQETKLRITVRIRHRKVTDDTFKELYERVMNCGVTVKKISWKHGKIS